jgi:hypothetical protein
MNIDEDNRRAQHYFKYDVDRAQPSIARTSNMAQAPVSAERRSCPKCRDCGVAMRLFGIESHPTIDGADLLTYVCSHCDGVQTEIVTPAFDAAWERVEANNLLPADKGQVASMRELLAKFIIAKAEQGEKDSKRLVETALLRLRLMRNLPE